MPGRFEPFETNGYYHIYNRGVAKQPIFLNEEYYNQALLSLKYYSFCDPPIKLSALKRMKVEERAKIWNLLAKEEKKLVSILGYCLMPNHWHLLLRQEMEEGIPKFVSQIGNSYARYFNTKENRVGPVFQGRFKSVRVESEEQLIHLSRYIHLNPSSAGIVKARDLANYPWSSLPDYLKGKSDFLVMSDILDLFSAKQTYYDFVFDYIGYSDSFKEIERQVLEREE